MSKQYIVRFFIGLVFVFSSPFLVSSEEAVSDVALDFHLLNAQSKIDANDLDGAIEDLNKAVESNKEEPSLYSIRGNLKEKQNDFEGALQDYTTAITLMPGNAWYYGFRGLLKIKMNNLIGAYEDYSKAIELDPEDEVNYSARASIEEQFNDYQAALKDLNKAIQLDAEKAINYATRAHIKKLMGNNASALKDYSKAIELTKENSPEDEESNETADLFYEKALLEIKTGNFKKAKLSLQKAKESYGSQNNSVGDDLATQRIQYLEKKLGK